MFVKAKYTNVIRRFAVPNGCSLSDLSSTLTEIFPELKSIPSECLKLHYTDTDGDVVLISSDNELHTAEGLIGEDKLLRLTVEVVPILKREKEVESPFIQHDHPWSLSLVDPPLVSLRRESLEKMRKEHMKNLKELEKKAQKAEKERRKGKSKSVEREEKRPLSPPPSIGWSVDHSWEPPLETQQDPHSTTLSWGPWKYTAYRVPTKNSSESSESDEMEKLVDSDDMERLIAEEPSLSEK